MAKLILGYAERVQYSGFEGYLTAKQIAVLTDKIRKLIDSEKDRVRLYRSPVSHRSPCSGSYLLCKKRNIQ